MSLKSVYINQIAAFLPNLPVTNDKMEVVLGQVGNKPSRARPIILKSNGIRSRHYVIHPETGEITHSNAELAALAIQGLFDKGVQADQVSCLACGTSYPDQIMPGHGVMVHGALKNVPPYEVASASGVCVAGISALKYAYNAIKAGEHQHAIASGSETASLMMRAENFQQEIEDKIAHLVARPELAFEKDFLRWMLSDGAGAVYLSDQPNSEAVSLKIQWIDVISYANEMPTCMYAGGDVEAGKFKGWANYSQQAQCASSLMSIKQDVKLLNENIILYTVEKALSASIQKHQLKLDQVDYFLPHYSSTYFRDKVAAGLKRINFDIPMDKWFTNLTTKGNTGAASIYIMLEEFMRTHTLTNGQNILCYIPESGRFSSAFMLLEVVYESQ